MTLSDLFITVSCDDVGFHQKPNKYEVSGVTKRIRTSTPKTMTISDFCRLIAAGHTFISGCVIDPMANTLKADNTHNFCFFGLDIDNKEYQVTPKEMIEEVKAKLGVEPTIFYDTFSSTNEHRKFRLLYFFQEPIKDYQTFKKMYCQLKLLFPNLIDNSTSNPNRLWFATNKANSVRLNPNAKLLGNDFFERLNEVAPFDCGGGYKRKKDINYSECMAGEYEDIYQHVSFLKEKTHELAEYVIENVSICDYVELAGAELKDLGSYYTCACPFHGGDNESGFVIYKHSNSAFCFTKNCCAGDVISLCKIYENKNYFDAIRSLLSRFKLGVPMDYIDKQKLLALLQQGGN